MYMLPCGLMECRVQVVEFRKHIKGGEDIKHKVRIVTYVYPAKKKSKVITEDVVKNADYVVTMTKKQKDALPYDNVFTFSELVGGGDIPDPYGLDQNAYDMTAFRLKLASQNLLNIISEKR